MSYRLSDIAHETETRRFWVYRDTDHNAYTVFRAGITHSTPDSSYPLNADGLSIAIARANYLDKQSG